MFDEKKTFTILQLADLHFGETPMNDIKTMGIQYGLIKSIKPDLVVLSGDMFSGHAYKCHRAPIEKDCYQNGWQQYTFPMRATNQKYAIILGNHDGEAELTRKQIIELDMKSPQSLTQQSPQGVSEGSNYYLPIYDQQGQQLQSLIWMFDSHKSGCQGYPYGWGCVEQDQLDWFKQQYQSLLQDNNKQSIQSVSFVHIPPPEYVNLHNEFETYGNAREAIGCPCMNTGLVDALIENEVQANYSGHDHNNDFGGIFHKNGKKIELQYGRKTGHGNYGPPSDMIRGGQVITLKSLGNGRIIVDSYIQDEAGNKIFKGKATKKQGKINYCPC